MSASRHALEELPGDLMMWVLIVSELLVFGAGLIAFLAMRVTDPVGLRSAAAIDTMRLRSGQCDARVRLHDLGLATAPTWRRGFLTAVALLVAAMLGLDLAA